MASARLGRVLLHDSALKYHRRPREVCELALAHVNNDRAEAAYGRSDLVERAGRSCSSGPITCPVPGLVEPGYATSDITSRIDDGTAVGLPMSTVAMSNVVHDPGTRHRRQTPGVGRPLCHGYSSTRRLAR